MAPSVQHRKVWLTPTARVSCSNAAKTQNPLKLAGVPQTRQRISAASGPTFTILRGHVEEILLVNTFFRLSIHALVAKTWPDKVLRRCADGDFLVFFLRPVFSASRVHCSTFQTCILNSHYKGHTMCGSMADIQPATAEIRRGKKEDRR